MHSFFRLYNFFRDLTLFFVFFRCFIFPLFHFGSTGHCIRSFFFLFMTHTIVTQHNSTYIFYLLILSKFPLLSNDKFQNFNSKMIRSQSTVNTMQKWFAKFFFLFFSLFVRALCVACSYWMTAVGGHLSFSFSVPTDPAHIHARCSVQNQWEREREIMWMEFILICKADGSFYLSSDSKDHNVRCKSTLAAQFTDKIYIFHFTFR